MLKQRAIVSLLLLTSVGITYLFYYSISHKTDLLINERYVNTTKEMKQQLKSTIKNKQNAILTLALSVAQCTQIKNALLSNNSSNLHLNEFSFKLKNNTEYKNIWFQLITPDGKSLYRSFSKKSGDNLLKARVDVAKILAHPLITQSISVGKYALSMKAMVPLYKNSQLIGIVEVIARFDSVITSMNDLGFPTVVLVDKSYKKQLVNVKDDRFLDNYFIATDNVNMALLEGIKAKSISNIVADQKSYNSCDTLDSITTLYTLSDVANKNPMAYFIMSKKISDINIDDIMQIRNNLFLLFIVALSIIISLFIYFYLHSKKNLVQRLNNELEVKVLQKTKELAYLAHHDTLTGLINRHLISENIKDYIEHFHTNFAILFLNLDRFKDINDSYGHKIGDSLLITIAKRVKNFIRAQDLVARIGGDEFIVLIKEPTKDTLIEMVKSIIDEIKEPIKINSYQIGITCSIGVSCYPEDANSSEELIINADMAMQKAKRVGRNRYQLYEKKMSEYLYERLELENNIMTALQNSEFETFYQPQVAIETGKVIGAEALIRWYSTAKGFISPDTFIPIAEETDLIIMIDNWMMKNSFAQLKSLQDEGIEVGKISLNISARQLESEAIIENLKAILEETAFDAKNVELEITERQMMNDPEASIITLKKIKELGITISMDDFGTGHSSLSYIKRLPIDKLKIDKSFIDELPANKKDIAIVRSIISIAKNLDIDIIAEGVENSDQKEFLLKEGCMKIQGYYYHKPMRINEYKKLLSK